jgi:serine/threonine protein kinase
METRMTPERWAQVKSLFLAALDHPESSRAAFLDQQCAADPDLRREVSALLNHHEPTVSPADSSTQTSLSPTTSATLPPDTLASQNQLRQSALRQALQEHLADTYEIHGTLGHGGSGVVFQARDLKLNRRVAIKCLYASAAAPQLQSPHHAPDRALQEARHLAAIAHPNIAAVYAVSENPQLPFIIMEYIDGIPLTEALAGGPLKTQLDAFHQVLRAVAELHHRGLVHRDLKPSNILLDRHNIVKLVDFGIAHPADSVPRRLEGTPGYIAPEQLDVPHPSAAADVFSLGVILFELLTGQRPFTGPTSGDILLAVRKSDPPLPRSLRPDIPGALQAICLTALEKNPAQRYPSARQFLLDLERFLNGEPVAANPALLASILDHGIERHINDLQRWKSDRMISTREYDYFLNKYALLRQREESWVLDSRRFTSSQVMLHLGAWACVVSTALMVIFQWNNLPTLRPVLPTTVFAIMLAAGLILWHARTKRVALVLLMAASLICPITVAVICLHYHLLKPSPDDLLAPFLNNRQFLAAFFAMFLLTLALWHHTKTAALALLWSLSFLGLATAILSLLGLRQQLTDFHLDTVAGRYLVPGAILFLLAYIFDVRARRIDFATPLYLMSVLLLLLAASAIAYFGPTSQWLGIPPFSDKTKLIEYSFMANGILYMIAGFLAERSSNSAALRRIGTLLLWLAPSHILIPIFHLRHDWPIANTSWDVYEILLPALALTFVFTSVPRQMKSFFFSGLGYCALAAGELTDRHFTDQFGWPVGLAVAGFALIFAAWRYPTLFDPKPHPNSPDHPSAADPRPPTPTSTF